MAKHLMAAAVLLMAAGIAGAQAEHYPARTVTIIVPFAAGGPAAGGTHPARWSRLRAWRSRRQGHFVDAQRVSVRLPQIVVHDFAEAERKVGENVDRGHDLEHR
jgi:hypothetical protein